MISKVVLRFSCVIMPVSFIECSRDGFAHHLTEVEKIRTSACLIIFQEHRNVTFLKQSSKKDMPNGLKNTTFRWLN